MIIAEADQLILKMIDKYLFTPDCLTFNTYFINLDRVLWAYA